ncbi:hypothetical protein FACS1894162_3970 [Bacteroidia bacterium]|nr:hypothetical protein FACS1894162_3970 [Bacteroidia bacterium]
MKQRNLILALAAVILPIASVTAQTISVPRVLVETNVVNSGNIKSTIPIDLQGTGNQLINQAAGIINVDGLQVGAGATLTNNGTIDVYVAVTGITVSGTIINLIGTGTTTTYTATVLPAGANQAVTWTSSNDAVATVTSAGLITAVANGTATITATSTANNSITGTKVVKVGDPNAGWVSGQQWEALSGNKYWTADFGAAGDWMTESLRELPAGVTTVNISAATGYTTPYVSIPGVDAAGSGGINLAESSISDALQDTIKKYGYLYNWNAAMGIPSGTASNAAPYTVENGNNPAQTPTQGICPAGWHLPSDYEWTQLEKEIAMDAANTYSSLAASAPADTAGMATSTTRRVDTPPALDLKMRAAEKSWPGTFVAGSSKAANAGGFDALPAGHWRQITSEHFGIRAYFWSSSSAASTTAYHRGFTNVVGSLRSHTNKYIQFSVRCKKD